MLKGDDQLYVRIFTVTTGTNDMMCSSCRKRGLAIGNWYGSGTGKAWLDYVYCSGSEDSLVYCSHADWGSLRYNWYSGDASIFCRPGLLPTQSIHQCYNNNNKKASIR